MGRIASHIDERWIEVATNEAEAISVRERRLETVERLRAMLSNADDPEPLRPDLGRALGRYAEALQLTGCFDEALEARDESVKIWAALERDRAEVLAELKAAAVAHLARDDDAWQRFDDVEKKIQLARFELYADFYWEFRARACCRESRWGDALECLNIALDFRIEQGRKERQLAETNALIQRVETQIESR